MVSFQRFRKPNMATTPRISTIWASLQCFCSSLNCASVTALGLRCGGQGEIEREPLLQAIERAALIVPDGSELSLAHAEVRRAQEGVRLGDERSGIKANRGRTRLTSKADRMAACE